MTGIALAIGCWAVIGFDGMLSYPHHVGEIASSQQGRSYSPYALLRALGVSSGSARVALVALTVAAIAAIVVLARGADGDRRAFAAALGVALVVSPIVWLHYFVLLAVVVALYRRRATAAWFLPLAFWLLGHQDSGGSPARILAAYAITAATVALAISPSLLPRRSARAIPAGT